MKADSKLFKLLGLRYQWGMQGKGEGDVEASNWSAHLELFPTMFRRKANGIIKGRNPVENDFAFGKKYHSKGYFFSVVNK